MKFPKYQNTWVLVRVSSEANPKMELDMQVIGENASDRKWKGGGKTKQLAEYNKALISMKNKGKEEPGQKILNCSATGRKCREAHVTP